MSSVEEPLGVANDIVEPVVEEFREPVRVTVEEQAEIPVDSQTANLGRFGNDTVELGNNFEEFKIASDELKEVVENSNHAMGENLQVMNDKFTNLEKKLGRINPALREEINALKVEFNILLQKERASIWPN